VSGGLRKRTRSYLNLVGFYNASRLHYAEKFHVKVS